MLILQLCQQDCPDKIPDNLFTKLGDGADGEVFILKDEEDKVIKFSGLFDYGKCDINNVFSKMESAVKYIQNENPSCYARIFSFAKLVESKRKIWDDVQQKYILYSYVMEKCFPISEDERKVFHSIISHEDLGIIKNYSEDAVKKMLNGMSRGLDFDAERVIFFYRNIKQSPVRHLDIHVRNIMKDGSGNFKLIDFDRITLET